MKNALNFSLCLSLILVGCAERQTSVVRQTLQSYQVGVTKFSDFKQDAGLVDLPNQTAAALQARSYTVPVGSPWKIYGMGHQENMMNGKFNQNWEFTVGDTNSAISKLCFDSSGTLIDITAPNVSTPILFPRVP